MNFHTRRREPRHETPPRLRDHRFFFRPDDYDRALARERIAPKNGSGRRIAISG